MNAGEIVSSVLGSVAVVLLAGILRLLAQSSRELRRFMAEHAWLLATTLWTRDKVLVIMQALNLPVDQPPPSDLPKHRG